MRQTGKLTEVVHNYCGRFLFVIQIPRDLIMMQSFFVENFPHEGTHVFRNYFW